MKILRFLFIATLASSLIACGTKTKKTDFFGVEEKSKKPKVENTTSLKRNWRAKVGDNIDAGDAIISPSLFGESLYAAAPNGRIEKIDASTGKTQWQVKLKKEVITGGVGVGGGLVLVGTDQGIVYAFNQSDGSLSWKVELSSEILASPVYGSEVVIARTGDGKVFGLAAFDGEVIWTIGRQLPRLTLRGDSRPLVNQGVAFVGFPDGTLVALDAKNGRALWDLPISFPRGTNEIERLSDIDTTPLLVGGNIYVSSYQEITHSLDIAEQKIAWSIDVSSFNSLGFDAAFLYISDREGVVHQIDRDTGEKVWSQTGLRTFTTSAPISIGPYVMVTDSDGTAFVMDKNDGSYVGRHSLGARTIVGDPIVDSDTIYFIDSSGNLQSMSLTGSS